MAGDEALVMTFSCDCSRRIFAKEKEFHSANEAYVLLFLKRDGRGVNGRETTCDGL